jgi:hypothetical protein
MVGPSEARDARAVCDKAILAPPQHRGPVRPESVIGPRGARFPLPAPGLDEPERRSWALTQTPVPEHVET